MARRMMGRVVVEVDQAKSFVDQMAAIAGFRRLGAGWAGDGTRAPSAKAIATAERLMRDRQTMAGRLLAHAGGRGDVKVLFRVGVDGDGERGMVHIDKDGATAILVGDEDGDVAARHQGVSSKAFRKALDALISPRQSRYGVKRVEVEGILFDSADEGRRYQILLQEERLGRIRDIRRQVAYRFEEAGRLCFTYRSDFNYVVVATGEEVVEDVKGVRTEIYRLKKKLVEARFGIEISEWPISRKEAARRAAAAERARVKEQKAQARREREERAAANRAERERIAAERAERKRAAAATKG